MQFSLLPSSHSSLAFSADHDKPTQNNDASLMVLVCHYIDPWPKLTMSVIFLLLTELVIYDFVFLIESY
jgi:hypothetical protein